MTCLLTEDMLPPSLNVCHFRFLRTLIKYILKHINIYDTLNLVFLINLFKDRNVIRVSINRVKVIGIQILVINI